MHIVHVDHEVPNTEFGAATYGAWCIINFLLEAGHRVTACLLLESDSMRSTADRERWIAALSSQGADVVSLKIDYIQRRRIWPGRFDILRRILSPVLVDYYPWVDLSPRVGRVLEQVQPDAILVYESTRAVAATVGQKVAPRLALQTDPDHLPGYYRRQLVPLRQRLSIEWLLGNLMSRYHPKFMIQVLRDCEAVGAVAAHDAEWFRQSGIPNCLYLRNLVPDLGGPEWEQRRAACPPRNKPKIVMVGQFYGTAGLAGYYLFADKMLPLLEQRLGQDGFEVHIVGRGAPPPGLAKKLTRPSIRLRGYVEDIEPELLSADIFLCPIPIELGVRGRIVFSWSFGCCVVSHRANTKGLPEMVHKENALLAENGHGLVEAVIDALENPILRSQMGANARITYERYFAPEAAGPRILAELERIVQESKCN